MSELKESVYRCLSTRPRSVPEIQTMAARRRRGLATSGAVMAALSALVRDGRAEKAAGRRFGRRVMVYRKAVKG